MNFLGPLSCALLLTIVGGAHLDLLKVSLDDKPEIDNYAFESEIKNLLEEIKEELKANGLEPLPVPRFDFSFYIRDSDLSGYVGDMLIYNVSDFEVKNVKFDLLQFKLTLELYLKDLVLDGQYKLNGNIFENLLDGEGHFLSNVTGLDLSVIIQLGSNFANSEIKDFELSFIFDDNHIIFDNIVTGEKNKLLDNSFLQPLIYRIRDEYFSVLLNTFKVVGSDLIHNYALQDILQIIIGIITGGGQETLTIFRSLVNEYIRRPLQ